METEMEEETIKLPTIDEFLQRKRYPFNSFVDEPEFRELYVRRALRFLGGKVYEVLDIARIEAKVPGSGSFARLADRLLGQGLNLYVESVLNPRFERKLLELGFTPSETAPQCYYKLGKQDEDEGEGSGGSVAKGADGFDPLSG
jgi:hypothetical protein